MSQPPHILFLMSDEHRPDVSGWEEHEIIRTLWLDALAAGGVVFNHAYTPSPTCVPARQCMLAGQLPKSCGCYSWGDDLAPGYMTFARRFAQWGYMTVACGKLAHTGPDQMQGWRRRIGADAHVNARHVPGLQQAVHDRYNPPVRQKWAAAREVRRAGPGRSPYAVKDDYTVQGAVDFIHDYFNSPYYDREQTRPLLLKVSLLQPHYPYMADLDRFNYYLNRVEPQLEPEPADHPCYARRLLQVGEDLSPREVRRATAAYYGMVEAVDQQLGRVLAALEQVGQDLDEWVVVYTSDHGEQLGQRGLWMKQTFYEESVRVPLIVRWPARLPRGAVVEENVSLCDLFATLCELCEIPVPEGLDSRSLLPLLRGSGEDWPNEAVSHLRRDVLMIKQDHLKYQWYGEGMPEVLFDLARDPGETANRVDDLAYAEPIGRFRARRDELGYGPGAAGAAES